MPKVYCYTKLYSKTLLLRKEQTERLVCTTVLQPTTHRLDLAHKDWFGGVRDAS